jgi:hypothetical protein
MFEIIFINAPKLDGWNVDRNTFHFMHVTIANNGVTMHMHLPT